MKKLIVLLLVLAGVVQARDLWVLKDAAGNEAIKVTTDDAGTSAIESVDSVSSIGSYTAGSVVIQTNVTAAGTVAANALSASTSVTAASAAFSGIARANALVSTTSVQAASGGFSGTVNANAFTATGAVTAASAVLSAITMNVATEAVAGVTLSVTNAPVSTNAASFEWRKITSGGRSYVIPVYRLND